MPNHKEPPFVRQLGALWTGINHIQDGKILRQHARDAVLVGFDIEGWTESVNEIGLAYLCIEPSKPLRALKNGNIDAFHNENDIEVRTIAIAERQHERRPGAARYGDRVVVSEAHIEQMLASELSNLRAPAHQLILVGYSMNTEFSWIARKCRSILSYFDHWVDVQELVHLDCGMLPGLANLMAHLAGEITPCSGRRKGGHRAAVDAVKMVGAASMFMVDAPIRYCAPKTVKLCSQKPGGWDNTAFRAKITAVDGGLLPTRISTPRQLTRELDAYDLKTVYIDAEKAVSGRSHIWWISVHTAQALEHLARHFESQTSHAQDLRVEKVVSTWVQVPRNSPANAKWRVSTPKFSGFPATT